MKWIALIALLSPLAAADVTLVKDSRPQAVILVPDELEKAMHHPPGKRSTSTPPAALAALELADYIEKISGARLLIRTESAADGIWESRIYVGACRETLALVRDKPLLPEEFLIRTVGKNLHIAGGDVGLGEMRCSGTLFGVYDFLERELQVRWLFPGEHGEVTPKRATLVIPALDRREQPRVLQRKLRNNAVSREDNFASQLKRWGVSVEAWKAVHGPQATDAWFRRQRLGRRTEIDAGHSFGGWWQKYGAEHPEWFALQPDGTRTQKPPRERLCKSNPSLWEQVARVKLAEFRANPAKRTASISPNDGGGNKFCMCPNCRALDPPEAPKVKDAKLVDPTTGQPFAEYPSLSDRVFTFYNEIAKRVRAQMPDRYLVGYAYSVYRTPPVRLKALEPNLIVGYVGLNLEQIEAWSKLATQLYIRPNDLNPSVDLGLPRNHAAHLARAIRFAVERGAIGFDFAGCGGNWSGHGLDYYMVCKAMWNPELDVPAVIADYCRAAYGAGADAMRRYHDRLAQISEAVRADELLRSRSPHAPRLRLYYTPEALAALEADIAAARNAIGTTDAAALARVQMAADSVQYARLVTALLEMAGKQKSPVFRERLAAVEALLKSKVLTPSLAPLHSYRYLRRALSGAEPEDE